MKASTLLLLIILLSSLIVAQDFMPLMEYPKEVEQAPEPQFMPIDYNPDSRGITPPEKPPEKPEEKPQEKPEEKPQEQPQVQITNKTVNNEEVKNEGNTTKEVKNTGNTTEKTIPATVENNQQEAIPQIEKKQGRVEGVQYPVAIEDINFIETVKNDQWFVLFFAPWCINSQALLPIWKEFGAKETKIKTATFDW